MSQKWVIAIVDTSETSRFAAAEFERLMGRLDGNAEVQFLPDAQDRADVLKIGMGNTALTVEDPKYDDGIELHVCDGKGTISGVNPRSVLIAVYRFFEEAGCMFLRPGREGEYIPRMDSKTLCVDVCEVPAYRHRGICIEGSNSFENIAEMIDYLPKIACNTYFTQFFRPYEFFERWYQHTKNPHYVPTPISESTVDAFVGDYSRMLQIRGLLHHRVGHGWTAQCLGLDANGWYFTENDAIAPEKRRLIAEIDGERRLFSGSDTITDRGVAINTNLCYSNPEVRTQMVREIVDYCVAHPEADYVHLWLADASDNQCECEECKKSTPSDLYVQILHEVDRRLTAINCDKKLVFLIYNELLWPPKIQRFRNPERFTLMFAPITRTYSHSYETDANGKMAEYERNRIALPRSVGDSLAYLQAWQELFSGDGFVYDYHYMWDHYYDLGGCRLPEILCMDIESLQKLHLDGFISCQITRCQFPTGLGQNLMGRALWQGSVEYEKEKQKYFAAAFGEASSAAAQYLEQLSAFCVPEYCRGERPRIDPDTARRYGQIPAIVDTFLPVIQENLYQSNPVHARAWKDLYVHSWLIRPLAKFLEATASGETEQADQLWKDVEEAACRIEPLVQPSFETFEFLRTYGEIFKNNLKQNSES